ncbi:glycosyltransferase [Tenacibaculum piscium]|uniref:Glycosyltransferase n=1 Tax=Tenacibaculum piscium TaxID=1458515 RepID=A0A2H1YKL0_9FLAO|nr:glycosyltransferase [Tenacibaculum piscium]MBE7629175.1 glycosyltransferase [Tenacibaculum piscium]MBE7669962.1 glycosyltransferase [Tenacibaculum piscium]MBE7685615.1 glycosyltransferase [Tenacibaculum piscium]MBE7690199.1 glycosyltransferase [Tenacibaculum piscium]MCG8183377.1 glycosyltransferase [Tenacibaculum piscium]
MSTQNKEMKYIFCMKWGTLYGPEYVNRLYAMVKKNLSYDFKMVCFTDDNTGIIPQVDCYEIPEMNIRTDIPERMWKKLTTLKEDLYGLKGTALFLDLDIVIVDKIDCFFEVGGSFRIIKDHSWRSWRITGNSSVYRFEIGKHGYVFNDFIKNFDEIRKIHRNEQEYLTHSINDHGNLQYWQKEWCPSFKYDCVSRFPLAFWKKPTIPEGAKIIIFHGEINPHNAIKGGRGKWYRYVRPAPWVADYWIE